MSVEACSTYAVVARFRSSPSAGRVPVGFWAVGLQVANSTPAGASTTTIGFDVDASGTPVPSGTAITSRYLSLGVTFGQGPFGTSQSPKTLSVPTGDAQSLPECLDITPTGCGEVTEPYVWAAFSSPVASVSLYVGNLPDALSSAVTLKGYDLGGNPVADAEDVETPSSQNGSTRAVDRDW